MGCLKRQSMITERSLLDSIHLEFDRNQDFRAHVARTTQQLRARGVTLPVSDRDALSSMLEDGRFLGKALLDDYLTRCTVPQWMQAKRCAGE